MMEGEPTISRPEGGLRASVKRLLESASSFAATKVELVGIELQEEKRNVVEILILVTTTLFFGFATLTLLTFILILAFPSPWCLLVLFVLYTALTLVSLVKLRRKLNTATQSFEATITELKKDTEWVRRNL